MPVNEFINLANSNLIRASEELIRESQELRSQIVNLEKEKNNIVDKVKIDIRQKEVLASGPETDSTRRAALLSEIQDDYKEVANAEEKFRQDRIKLDEGIKKREQAINDIKIKMSDISQIISQL